LYRQHFHLEASPFEPTPDPAFFYLGPQYRETLAAMIHCVVSRKALMVISGPIGSGKTTLGRTLTRYLPEGTRLVSVLHPFDSQGELMIFIAHRLGISEPPESRLLLTQAVNDRLSQLVGSGGRLLVIIDEAQLLSEDNLEEIRLLSNLETETVKLIQVILLGQPELVKHLNAPKAKALKQRMSAIKVLEPLDRNQTKGYIQHRMKVAGGDPTAFTEEALELIAASAGGIPRVINQICDAALLNAFAADQDRVETAAVEEAVAALGEESGVGEGRTGIDQEAAGRPEGGGTRFELVHPAPEAETDGRAEPAEEKAVPEKDQVSQKLFPSTRTPPPRKAVKVQGQGSWLMAVALLILSLAALTASLFVYFDRPDWITFSDKTPPAEEKGQTGGRSNAVNGVVGGAGQGN